MATLSHFSFFFLPGKPFFPFPFLSKSHPGLIAAATPDVVFYSTAHNFQLVTSNEVVELPFPPPDVRTRHVVEFVQDRLIVCGGGESWQGPFHASCYQVLTQSFSPQFSFLVEPKLHGMDCFRA